MSHDGDRGFKDSSRSDLWIGSRKRSQRDRPGYSTCVILSSLCTVPVVLLQLAYVVGSEKAV